MQLSIDRKLTLCILLLFASMFVQAKDYKVLSPDNKTEIIISVNTDISWSVYYENNVLISPGKLSLELDNGTILGNNPKVKKAKNSSVNDVIEVPVPTKSKLIPEEYNQITIDLAGNYSVVFRAYNDGVAYRFETKLKDEKITVKNEVVEFNFPDNIQVAWPSTGGGFFGAMRGMMATVKEPGFGSKNPTSGRRGGFGGPPPGNAQRGNPPGGNRPAGAPNANRPLPGGAGAPPAGSFPRRESNPFSDSYEYLWGDSLVASVNKTAGLPVYFSSKSGTKMVILESDVLDYPNMFLKGTGTKSVLGVGVFPPCVTSTTTSRSPFGGNNETADYIAKTKGERTFPWRAMAISKNDAGLLENELVYKLASPSVIETGWIKPGQVAWEWYNGTNIYGVDFESGINTPTYKYYIDFATKYDIPYLLIDAGWLNNDDVDIPEIIKYGQAKNVDIILWVAWTTMYGKVAEMLDQFEEWGAKGVKMDYMNRADQQMVDFYEEMAAETAKHHMLLDFHGAYKPTGLRRKYPNVVNFEGVKGMEHNKLGSTDVTPSHDVTLLFTRMVAGPMDYTPGAVVTVAYGNFKNISSEPMSQGTRAHQAAMYVMYDAPIQMLADNPTLYMREEPFIKFLTQIPTVWDKTIGIDGKIGQYAIMARKSGDKWYIGAMTDWSEREFDIPLDFLDNKNYKVEILEDGVNANKRGVDYKISTENVTANNHLKISMKQGGGWAAILSPAN